MADSRVVEGIKALNQAASQGYGETPNDVYLRLQELDLHLHKLLKEASDESEGNWYS